MRNATWNAVGLENQKDMVGMACFVLKAQKTFPCLPFIITSRGKLVARLEKFKFKNTRSQQARSLPPMAAIMLVERTETKRRPGKKVNNMINLILYMICSNDIQ